LHHIYLYIFGELNHELFHKVHCPWNIFKYFHISKITIKGATPVSEHSLKLHFCMLENHKWSIIVWIVIIFLGIFFINCKVYILKVWHNSKMFSHVQSTQTSRVDNACFFQMSFFTKCAPFLLKIGEDFNIDD
jgi:hypothetical protein